MRKSFKFIGVLAGLILIFYWVYLPVLTRYRELKAQEDTILGELETLNRQIKTLQEERNLLKNDVAYLEKVIREELGLVKPGEVVYKFVEEGTQPEAAKIESTIVENRELTTQAQVN